MISNCRFWKEETESTMNTFIITTSKKTHRRSHRYGNVASLRKKKISVGFMLISQVLKEDMFVVKKLSDGDDFKKVKSWSSKLISLLSVMKRHCYCEHGR